MFKLVACVLCEPMRVVIKVMKKLMMSNMGFLS